MKELDIKKKGKDKQDMEIRITYGEYQRFQNYDERKTWIWEKKKTANRNRQKVNLRYKSHFFISITTVLLYEVG